MLEDNWDGGSHAAITKTKLLAQFFCKILVWIHVLHEAEIWDANNWKKSWYYIRMCYGTMKRMVISLRNLILFICLLEVYSLIKLNALELIESYLPL